MGRISERALTANALGPYRGIPMLEMRSRLTRAFATGQGLVLAPSTGYRRAIQILG